MYVAAAARQQRTSKTCPYVNRAARPSYPHACGREIRRDASAIQTGRITSFGLPGLGREDWVISQSDMHIGHSPDNMGHASLKLLGCPLRHRKATEIRC